MISLRKLRLTHLMRDAGNALVNPNVPVFAICVGAANSVWAYVRGHITGAQAMHQIMLDGAARAGLAVAGGFVGKTVGLLVFGPAGALVLGAALPVLSQAQAKRLIDSVGLYVLPGYEQWDKETSASVDALVVRLKAALEAKTAILRTKYRSLGCEVLGRYVKARIEDDARFLRESKVRLERAVTTPNGPEGRALAVVAWAVSSTVHPALFQAEMKALFEVLGRRPSITAPIRGGVTAVGDAIIKRFSAIGSAL
ncbi:MAG: hypothetical protein ACREXK_03200 [Gammaproteobacteria bacterium]